jgi:hypothetical protein
MKFIGKGLKYLFGCHHRNLSRVFTISGQSYRVCWDCGAKYSYSLETMSIKQRPSSPHVAGLCRAAR